MSWVEPTSQVKVLRRGEPRAHCPPPCSRHAGQDLPPRRRATRISLGPVRCWPGQWVGPGDASPRPSLLGLCSRSCSSTPPPRLVTAHVACRPPEVRTPGQSGEGRLLPAALGPPRGVEEAGGWLACAQCTPRPPGCGWEPSCHLGSFVSPDEPAFIFVLRLRQVMCDTLARGQCSRLCGRGDPRSPAAPPPSAPRPQPGGCAVGRLQRSARRGRPGLLSPCFRRRLHRATWPPESLWKVDAPPSRGLGLFRPRFPRAPWWLCCLKRPERHAGAPSSPCVALCG